MSEALEINEALRLTELETVVERGMDSFTAVASALYEIKQNKLYREKHSSFEDYCRNRWGMSRSYAYKLINSAAALESLPENVDHGPQITSERQARELAKVPEEQRAKVLELAAESGQVTAKSIHDAAQAVTASNGETATESNPPSELDNSFNLSTQSAEKPEKYYTVEAWNKLSQKQREEVIAAGFESSDKPNQQNTDSIEWARWSLNTVTGCKHSCPYCYARDIAERLFPQKFEPVFLPSRLAAPGNIKVPGDAEKNPSQKNIFANSMSDLFGSWVPKEWIDATIEMVTRNPQWNFLFLTKNPLRATEFAFPPNWWMGTTVDAQARVAVAEKAFAEIGCEVKWLSCEPLLEPLVFSRLNLFQWIAIGGSSPSKNTPMWIPPFDWIAKLHMQARNAGVRVYHKSNLGLIPDMRVKEFPWGNEAKKSLPSQFKYLKGM